MHEVLSHVEGESLHPAVALVCYRVGSDAGRLGFASRHPIEVGEGGVPRIQPGTPLRQQELRDIVAALSQRDLAWIDPRIVAQSNATTIWWTPPAIRTLWWKPVNEASSDYASLPTRCHAVPVPGLVFRLDHGLAVFAVATDDRPRPETPLFHAPFANVYDLGGVCMGDARPNEGNWPAWDEAFFASVFTHDVGSIRRVAGFEHSYQALDRLVKMKAKRFPGNWLRAAHKDLGWLIAEGSGGAS